MVATRSKTSQTKLDDFATSEGVITKGRKSPKSQIKSMSERKKTVKRKSSSSTDTREPEAKRSKNTASPADEPEGATEYNSDKIIINRAPVLQLWSACVAQFVYPKLSWESCLSAGSAVSTICAISKGRSIGTVPDRDESESKEKKHQENRKAHEDLDDIEVLQFKLKLKDGLALIGSGEQKGKPGSEESLKKKFGEKEYQATKQTFEESLKTWKGLEDELNKSAFGFYEKFRPNVKQGQKGWGRKGELDLNKVKNIVVK